MEYRLKKFLLIAALLCLPVTAWAHTCTLTGSYATLASTAGHWTGTGCTGGSYVAGAGDTAIFNAAALIVGSAETWNIGTSSGALAISCQNPGDTNDILIVGGKLHDEGDYIDQCNATWILSAGSTFQYDSTGNSSPSTANYAWNIGYANCVAAPCPLLEMQGTYASQVTIQVAAGSGNFGGFGNGTYQDSGAIQATWANFTNCGTSSLPCVDTFSWYSVGLTTNIQYSTFASSGVVELGYVNTGTGTTFWFNHDEISSPISSSGYGVIVNTPGNDSTFSCQLENDAIQGQLWETITNSSDYGTDDGCIVSGTFGVGTTSISPYNGSTVGHAPGHFDGDMWVNQLGSSAGMDWPAGSITRQVVLLSNPTTTQHLVCAGLNTYAPTTINGMTYEREFNDGAGLQGTDSCLLPPPGGAASQAITVENVVAIPAPNGFSPAQLINMVGACAPDCPVITAEHNTVLATPGATSSGFASFSGEGSTAQAGLYARVADNICWLEATATGMCTGWFNSNTPVNGTYGNVGNNDTYNFFGAPYSFIYYGAAGWYGGGTPGTAQSGATPPLNADITANPNFEGCYNGSTTAIGNCTFLTYGQTRGYGPSSWSDIFTQMMCMNQPYAYFCGEDNGSILRYYYWTRQGFAPTNVALHNAASDGADIGAVAYYATPVVPSQLSGLLTSSTDLTCTGGVPCSTWPMPTLPAAGSSYSDSTWGTTTWRLQIPAANTAQAFTCYSRVQAWNSDQTKMMLCESGASYMDLYDATTTPPTPINRITISDGTSLYAGSGDAYWANTNPNLIYYIPFAGSSAQNLTLRSVNISGCNSSSCTLTPTTIHTFSATSDKYYPAMNINECSVFGGVATVTAYGQQYNQTSIGNSVYLNGFTGACQCLNGQTVTVLSSGFSSGGGGSFEANVSGCQSFTTVADNGIAGLSGVAANVIESGSGGQGGFFDATDTYFSFTADNSNVAGRAEIDFIRYNKSTDTVTTQKKWYSVCAGGVPSGCGVWNGGPNTFADAPLKMGINMIRMNQHPSQNYIGVLWQCGSDNHQWAIGCGAEYYSPTYQLLGPASAYNGHLDHGYDVNGYPVFVGVNGATGSDADQYAVQIARLDQLSPTSVNATEIQLPCTFAYLGATPCAFSFPHLPAKTNATHVSMTGTWGSTPGYALYSTMTLAGYASAYVVDSPAATTLGTAVTVAGSHTVTPGSMASIAVGTSQVIDWNTANTETVVVTGVTTTTFTATFVNTHSGQTGVVNTSGSTVSWVSGTTFSGLTGGNYITVNGVLYTILSVGSSTSLTLQGLAGTQTGVAYTSGATISNVSTGDTGWLANENGFLQIDSTQPNNTAAKYWRVSRAMSIRDQDYNSEPHTAVNRDSTAITWGANWNVDPGNPGNFVVGAAVPVYPMWLKLSGGTVNYGLTVSASGTGGGSFSGTNCVLGTTSYASGTSYSCTATAAGGSAFSSFTGTTCSGSATGNVYSGILTANCTVNAVFNSTGSLPASLYGVTMQGVTVQ